MTYVLISVGTSLLGNLKRNNTVTFEAAEEYFLSDPKGASAEANTLERMIASRNLHNDTFVFLHSATDDGKWCSHALKAHYTKVGFKCREIEIEGLDYNAKGNSDQGLRNLIRIVFAEVNEANKTKESVLFCATGGFKIEIAYLNMIGMLLGIPVFYVHEFYKELMELPVLPVHWDMGFVEQHLSFFQWIDAEPRSDIDANSRLQAAPELQHFTVLDSSDGCRYLSASGEMLLQAYRNGAGNRPSLWPPISDKMPSEKNQISGEAHHRPKGVEALIDYLCKLDFTSSVRYIPPPRPGHTAISDASPEDGTIKISFSDSGKDMGLLVGTTVTTEPEMDLVMAYLKRQKWFKGS